MADSSDTHRSEADVWRVRYAVKNGSASWGDRQFFEDEDALEGFLIDAMIQAEATGDAMGRSRRSVREWWWGKTKKEADDKPTIKRIIAIEHMENGEWVEKKATLHAPWVELI